MPVIEYRDRFITQTVEVPVDVFRDRLVVEEVEVPVEKIVTQIVHRDVEKPVIQYQDVVVEREVQVPVIEYRDRLVEVQIEVPKIEYRDRLVVEQQDKVVIQHVDKIVETIVEVPRIEYQERVVKEIQYVDVPNPNETRSNATGQYAGGDEVVSVQKCTKKPVIEYVEETIRRPVIKYVDCVEQAFVLKREIAGPRSEAPMQMSQLSTHSVAARPSRTNKGKYGFGIRAHEFEQILRGIFDDCSKDGFITEANREEFVRLLIDAHSGGNYSHEQEGMILRAFVDLENKKLGSSNKNRHDWKEIKEALQEYYAIYCVQQN